MDAVFFDIGDTLASVTLPAGGGVELGVYPYVPDVLTGLRDGGARLGIISNPGPIPASDVDEALTDAGLLDLVDRDLVVYGRKDSPVIFAEAAARAGNPARTVFVGEDPGERQQALQAGFLVAPHPLLAAAVLEDEGALRYVRVTAPAGVTGWHTALHGLAVLPLHAEGGSVIAVATTRAAARLDDLGFHVDRLGAPGEPATTAAYLLRDDRQQRSGFGVPEGNSADVLGPGPLASTAHGLLVAIPAGESVEDRHFRGSRHGHNLKLVPITLAAASGAVAPSGVPSLDAATRTVLGDRVDAHTIEGHVARYSGMRPAGAGVVIESRHILHPGNAQAVDALVADLSAAAGGRLTVGRHRFGHEGRRYENVEAELAGRGLDGVVLVTAHLDSTAARRPGYRPALDPAPGADDDASGTAAVLAAADVVAALADAAGVPHRAVRFVLFNAEEHGLVGSLAYARDQAALGTPIVAVLQLDMIGYDVRPGAEWELHAGFTPSPQVEQQSLALARTVAALAPLVSPGLPAAQLCPAPGEPDPAERRSDHYSFQLHGYPACLASEDLFAGPGPAAPPEEMNPEYHSPTDKSINAGYAADIARAVIAAAWVAATRP